MVHELAFWWVKIYLYLIWYAAVGSASFLLVCLLLKYIHEWILVPVFGKKTKPRTVQSFTEDSVKVLVASEDKNKLDVVKTGNFNYLIRPNRYIVKFQYFDYDLVRQAINGQTAKFAA